MSRTTTYWPDDADVVYVTNREQQTAPDDEAQHDEALVRAIVRAIQRSPQLHAMLRMALEHKI